MTVLSARERGDMAEDLLPIAAHLAVLVHGEGGPEDVQQVLAGLDDAQRTALIVVLAGLVDPDQPMGRALGWLDFNEHGQTVVPAWGAHTTVRDLAPEPTLEDDDEYVDPVAVRAYRRGVRVRVNDRERLAAVVLAVRDGMKYPQLDDMHGLRRGSTSTFISRIRKAFVARGEEFPSLDRPDQIQFTEEQVIRIRERSAEGATDLEVAMSYGVDAKTIGHICRGQHYARYGGPIRKAKSSKPREATRVVWGGSKGEFMDINKSEEIAA